jgi:hypothetical protein
MRAASHFTASLLILSALATHAASTQFYGLALGRRYTQNTTATPVLLTAKNFEARAFVYASTTTTASIKKPNNTTVNLLDVGGHLEFSALYDTSSALNSAWPVGNYTINLSNASDGTKASTMFIGNDLYPVPARVSNFTEAQAITAGQSFTLTWDSLGRPANDLVEVVIDDVGAIVFQTSPIPGAPGALNGFSTGVTIPSDRLQQGHLYNCTITVWRAITRDTATIAGALGETAYIARTILPLRTRFAIQDVQGYAIEKRINYEQTSTTPALRANAYEMTALVAATIDKAVTGATFRSPAGTVSAFSPSGADYSLTQTFAAPSALDAAFPPGAYFISMTTKDDGVRTNTLTLNSAYPQAPPQILNIDEAQYIKPAAPFTLSWNLPDGVLADLVEIEIREGTNIVFSTPPISGMNSALIGNAQSITIPAGTFSAGKIYSGMLRHCRPSTIDPFTFPLAPGMAGLARVTRFSLQTAYGSSPQPTINPLSRINDQTELTCSSVRGEKYMIQLSSALPNWTPGPTITASGPSTVFRLPAGAAPATFYRIVIAP